MKQTRGVVASHHETNAVSWCYSSGARFNNYIISRVGNYLAVRERHEIVTA